MTDPEFHGPRDYLDLARSADATPDELRRLADSEYSFVIEAVARHPATPTDVLASLLPRHVTSWSEQGIVLALARNPHSDVATLRSIATFVPECLHVRDAHQAFEAGIVLFEREDTPESLLVELLDDPRATTEFRKVAARQTTHPAVVDALREDRSERVRRAASRRSLRERQ